MFGAEFHSCSDPEDGDLVDFEQPRALWSKVWNDEQREAYVQNVAGHFGGVKSQEVKARQRKSHQRDLLRLQADVGTTQSLSGLLLTRVFRTVSRRPLATLACSP